MQSTNADLLRLKSILWGHGEPISSLLYNPPIQHEEEVQEDVTTTVHVRPDHADLVMPEDNSDMSDEVNELSQKQCQRLQHQANTILLWLEKRSAQLSQMFDYFATNDAYTMRDFYSSHPWLTIESLVKAVCIQARVCVKTFRKWRKEFILLGKFHRDDRGLAQFGWLLVNADKKAELTYWLKSQKQLSVADTRDWINGVLLQEFPIGRTAEYGRLKRPIVPSTAHRWMLQCGAKYEPVTQSYVTSAHQRHSTLLYRTWFCDLDYFLSLRQHRWVCFSNSSLKKLKDHYKDRWPHDSLGHKIPVEDVGKFPPGNDLFPL